MNTCFSLDGRAGLTVSRLNLLSDSDIYPRTWRRLLLLQWTILTVSIYLSGFHHVCVWAPYIDMTQHSTTSLPKSNTSLSRSSTRKQSPKARTYQLSFFFQKIGTDVYVYISELLQEITKETSRYIRHSLRSGGATPLTTKDEQIPQKIDQSYTEVDKLAQEKIQLAERLGALIQRARTRLDYDLRRVLILQGEDPGQPAFVSTSRNPVQEMNDSLRLAIAESSPIIPQAPVVLPTTQAPTHKSAFCPPLLFPHVTTRRG